MTMSVRYVFMINILASIAWAAFQYPVNLFDFIFGFFVGFVILAIIHRSYGRRIFALVAFIIYLIWSIIVSSVQVAIYVLSPKLKLDQGIIAIPLTVESELEIATLATAITLTPGTLSVDVGTDSSGQRVLWVHNLVLGDREAVEKQILEGFERRILQATRGKA